MGDWNENRGGAARTERREPFSCKLNLAAANSCPEPGEWKATRHGLGFTDLLGHGAGAHAKRPTTGVSVSQPQGELTCTMHIGRSHGEPEPGKLATANVAAAVCRIWMVLSVRHRNDDRCPCLLTTPSQHINWKNDKTIPRGRTDGPTQS